MKRFVFLGAMLALSACATPYQEMGLTGGVQANQITADTFQITARGNGYTDPDTVQRYALRKAAETTLANGFDLFVISNTADRTQTGSVTGGSAYGTRYGVFGTSSTWQVVAPGQTLWVRTFKYPKPDPMPDGMYDAREVLRYLAPPTADRQQCAPDSTGAVQCH